LTREAVLAALEEHDQLGRDAFQSRYGFKDAKHYHLIHDGKQYDSKAIAGVAHRFVPGAGGQILHSANFTGGRSSVVARLRKLGFEVPDAPRNEVWSRDELILALDLYMQNPKSPPGKQSRPVAELAKLLDTLGTITGATKTSTYRNANGVYLKMMNFRRFDPEYLSDGKTGMTRGNKLERVVWDEFASDLPRLREVASSIRLAVTVPAVARAIAAQTSDEPYEAEEGGVILKWHRTYERDRKIINDKKRAVLASKGTLACEACSFDFGAVYGPLGDGFIEVHHTKPVHQMKPGERTRLEDLALLCSNCHRMVHRERTPLTLETLRTHVRQSN
jgi:5-methylcytosine-specific restriction protein A